MNPLDQLTTLLSSKMPHDPLEWSSSLDAVMSELASNVFHEPIEKPSDLANSILTSKNTLYQSAVDGVFHKCRFAIAALPLQQQKEIQTWKKAWHSMEENSLTLILDEDPGKEVFFGIKLRDLDSLGGLFKGWAAFSPDACKYSLATLLKERGINPQIAKVVLRSLVEKSSHPIARTHRSDFMWATDFPLTKLDLSPDEDVAAFFQISAFLDLLDPMLSQDYAASLFNFSGVSTPLLHKLYQAFKAEPFLGYVQEACLIFCKAELLRRKVTLETLDMNYSEAALPHPNLEMINAQACLFANHTSSGTDDLVTASFSRLFAFNPDSKKAINLLFQNELLNQIKLLMRSGQTSIVYQPSLIGLILKPENLDQLRDGWLSPLLGNVIYQFVIHPSAHAHLSLFITPEILTKVDPSDLVFILIAAVKNADHPAVIPLIDTVISYFLDKISPEMSAYVLQVAAPHIHIDVIFRLFLTLTTPIMLSKIPIGFISVILESDNYIRSSDPYIIDKVNQLLQREDLFSLPSKTIYNLLQKACKHPESIQSQLVIRALNHIAILKNLPKDTFLYIDPGLQKLLYYALKAHSFPHIRELLENLTRPEILETLSEEGSINLSAYLYQLIHDLTPDQASNLEIVDFFATHPELLAKIAPCYHPQTHSEGLNGIINAAGRMSVKPEPIKKLLTALTNRSLLKKLTEEKRAQLKRSLLEFRAEESVRTMIEALEF